MDQRVSTGIRRPQNVLGETPLAGQAYTRGYPLPLYILNIPGRELGAGTRRRGYSDTIYYVSKVLNKAESRYPPIEKMTLALVITARKLCPYFLSYPVGARTNTPLKKVLGKPKASGQLVKWAIELSEYDISYLPRTTIKAQALADFVFEMTGTTQEEVSEERPWLLHVDGSSTTQGSGAGVLITTLQGDDMEFAIKFDFKASNNEAKYEALVLSMRMAQDASALHLLAYSDSQLIVKQVYREYEAKEESMVQYLQLIEELKTKFKSFQLQQIPREENITADSLFKLASALEDCKTRRITVQHLPQPRGPLNIQAISSNDSDWRTPIILWIDEGHLSGNRWEATKDARYLVNKCEKCQKHATLIYQPVEPLNVMLSPCHFPQWGMDIVGPFTLASGQRKFLIIAIDYFTKLVEAEPLARLHIKQRFTSVYPQANGQVEVTNRILVQSIKKRLDKVGGNWAEELTSVLWSYRTTPRDSTEESPFTLEHQDLVDELRETAFIRTQRYKRTMMNAHNKRVKARHFQVGDLVLRRVHTLKPVGKLDPKWEGPYKITKIIENGAYELEDAEGHTLSRPWNIHNLRRFYS
ncbi:UNVERIFIED_CONTAM: hypothetical protein Slati_1394500 [Sesamum latifolium]|uniref:Uncharacterized protein n=1 Tax=Sesamum latifolium TaxID=2727402 RepID=A0AAW2X637_9LAMI